MTLVEKLKGWGFDCNELSKKQPDLGIGEIPLEEVVVRMADEREACTNYYFTYDRGDTTYSIQKCMSSYIIEKQGCECKPVILDSRKMALAVVREIINS